MTPQEGFSAARTLHQRRVLEGWRTRGRKIGFTNRSLWPIYGVREPIWGYVYDRTLVNANDECELSLEGLQQPRIEPEICFGLKAAPSSSDPQALLRCLDWVAHAIEIVQCTRPGWKGLSVPGCIAENGLHGRLVLGRPVPADRLGDLAAALPRVALDLRKGETVVDHGTGEKVLGSPLAALGALVEMLSDDERLAPGEIVSTGTLTDAHPVAPGETWSTELRGLPLAGLRVVFR